MCGPSGFHGMDHSRGKSAGTAHIPVRNERYSRVSSAYRTGQCAPIIHHGQMEIIPPFLFFQEFLADHVDVICDLLFLKICSRRYLDADIATLRHVRAI